MKKRQLIIVIGVAALMLLLLFSSRVFYIIQPGERGVIFRPFTSGLDKKNIQQPGFHIIAPWNDIHVYNVKEQKAEETMDVLDKNGLKVIIETSVRFNPIYQEIGSLHEVFGKFYINQLVIPEVRSSVRQVAGRYTAEEIYSTKRSEVEQAIIKETNKSLSENYIDMRALLIRSINLPTQIQQAIESKLTQEQEFLAYQFKLEKEKSEAERRKIAAEGESRANQIINNSLTTNLLRMRGIEATAELANSPNTKIIVVGSGKDGLPLILGGN